MPVYFDNSATSYPKPESVYLAMDAFMRNNGSSPGRGNYVRALEAERLLYETRKSLAKLLGVPKTGRLVFTQNVTESINTVLKGYLRPGDSVLTSNIEHNALWRPLKKMEQEGLITLDTFSVAPDGTLSLSALAKQIHDGTRLVAFLHASNVLGNLLPLDDIIALAHDNGVAVLVDAAQSAGVYPLHAKDQNIDFLAFTGHKGLMGPSGTGGFYMREGLELDTLIEGGTGSMSKSSFMPDNPPDRFEAGTLNMPGLAGLKAGVNFVLETGVDTIRHHELKLVERLRAGLTSLDKVTIYGPKHDEQKVGILTFNIAGYDPYKVAFSLDNEHGIMVRAGLHCAPQAHRLIGTEDTGTVRVSIGVFNTPDEVDALVAAIKTISK